jgi:hypothetical protein
MLEKQATRINHTNKCEKCLTKRINSAIFYKGICRSVPFFIFSLWLQTQLQTGGMLTRRGNTATRADVCRLSFKEKRFVINYNLFF